MKTFFRISLSAFVMLASAGLWADEEKAASELTLPWDAFEKLLQPNRNDISLGWDDFQRLVKQTGVQEMPNFQLQNGRVVLSRDEFKALLDRMKAPSTEALRAFLTKAQYQVVVGKKSTTVTARLRIQVTGKPNENQPLRIPLFPASVAFRDVLWDGQPALVENDGSQLSVLTAKPGDHELLATFSTSGSQERPPFQVSFSIPRTAITEVTFSLPTPHVDVLVANASHQDSLPGAGTQVQAVLPAGDTVNISWNAVESAKQKGPAKVYAVLNNLLSIEEDALRVRTKVELNVLQNNINAVSLRVPEGYNVLDVQGEAIGEWSVRGEEPKVLVVPLQYGRMGPLAFTITSELILKEKNGVAAFNGFQVLDAVRENGYVGVELKTTAEAKMVDTQGLDRLDIQELPPGMMELTQRPLIFGMKYLRQPFQVSLDIQRHQQVAVISTVIDQANGITLVMDDGKRVHHVTYTVRNTWKQFLELTLPRGAQLWTAFVEGQQVKPSKNAEGKILIPLNRSKAAGGNLTGFDVEIMYYEGTSGFWPAGLQALEFPVPDVVVSQALWSVYLPVTYDYLYFGGSVDKEQDAQGLSPLFSAVAGRKRILNNLENASVEAGLFASRAISYEQKAQRVEQAKNSVQWMNRGKFDSAQGVDDATYARQVEREVNFFKQVQEQGAVGGAAGMGEAGVLPIRVNVPNSGEVYRFSKRVLVDTTPLTLRVAYVNRWLMKFALLALILGLLRLGYRFRANLRSYEQRGLDYLKRHEALLRWYGSPRGLVAGMAIVTVVAFFMAPFVFVLAILGMLLALGRWGWSELVAVRSR